MCTKRMNSRLTSIIAALGTAVFLVLGTAGVASAAPAGHAKPPARHYRHHRPPPGPCIGVQLRTSGAFSNDMNILQGSIVPGSVSVVATQGAPGSINPPVDTFGPGTGYTVSPDFHVVTLQMPYAGSNDGFVTHYAVFKRTCFRPRPIRLQTFTSGAFSNDHNIVFARNIVFGSVFVVANLGLTSGQDNPSVNGFANGNGYTVAYFRNGYDAHLASPFAGSNDGFVTYYTVWAFRR